MNLSPLIGEERGEVAYHYALRPFIPSYGGEGKKGKNAGR